jgi:hypothetical protein
MWHYSQVVLSIGEVIVMALRLSLRNGSAVPFRLCGNPGCAASAEPPNLIKCVTASRRHSARMVAKPMPKIEIWLPLSADLSKVPHVP